MTPDQLEIKLLKGQLKDWKSCYNITVIMALLKRIDELKMELDSRKRHNRRRSRKP